MFRFAHPEYLYILLIVPVLIGMFYYSVYKRSQRLKKIGDKQLNVNAAEIIIEDIKYDTTNTYLGKPFYLLALTTDQFDDFLKYNTMPSATDTTAVIASYSTSHKGYKLDLAYFITKHLRNEIVEEDDVIEMILMPVLAETSTSTESSQSSSDHSSSSGSSSSSSSIETTVDN